MSVITAPNASAATRAGSTNTGVPTGTVLKKYVGDLVITKAGTVISGLDVYGNVTVKAPNVTITKTRIRGNSGKIARDLLSAGTSAASGLVVTKTTIRPDTPTPYQRIGIRLGATNQLVQAVNISGTVDGIRVGVGSGMRIENSWLHDFPRYSTDPEQSGGSHNDAVQVEGGSGIRITGNSMTGAYNAAVQVTQGLSKVSDMWINSNYADGGLCTLNIAKKSYGKMVGLQAKDNRFGRSLKFGSCPMLYVPSDSDLKPSGNVWDDSGKAIPLPR